MTPTERMTAESYRKAAGLPRAGADRQAPKLRMQITTETQLQIAVATWFRALMAIEALPFHVPNGELRNAATAARLQTMGVKPGVPDWCIPTSRARTHWIELKRPGGGTMSDEQRRFRDLVTGWGHTYDVCRSIEEVYQVLRREGVAFSESPIARAMREAGC